VGLLSGLKHKAQATTLQSHGHLHASSIPILILPSILTFKIIIPVYNNNNLKINNKKNKMEYKIFGCKVNKYYTDKWLNSKQLK
jgi:hypothetical protein